MIYTKSTLFDIFLSNLVIIFVYFSHFYYSVHNNNLQTFLNQRYFILVYIYNNYK